MNNQEQDKNNNNILIEIALLKEKNNNNISRIEKLENDFKELKILIKESNLEIRNDIKENLSSFKNDIKELYNHKIKDETEKKSILKTLGIVGTVILSIGGFLKFLFDFLHK